MSNKISSLSNQVNEYNTIEQNMIDYMKVLHNHYQESKGNIKIFCRVHPQLITKEKDTELISPNINHFRTPHGGTNFIHNSLGHLHNLIY